MSELWRTSLQRIQKRFQDAVDQGCRLKCYLIQSAIPHPSPRPPDLPDKHQSPVAYGAGASCGARQSFDAEGSPVAQEPGFSRTHRFFSDGRDWFAQYKAIADDAGIAVQGIPIDLQQALWKQLPTGSRFPISPDGVWTDAVFELAWQHVAGAPLSTNKFAWLENLSVDVEAIESFRSGASQAPPEIKSPPDHWYSRIDDLFVGSVAAVDILLSMQDAAPDEQPTNTEGDDAPPIPNWNHGKKLLTFNGVTVKRFRHTAKNQFLVLDAFEEMGWLNTIDDPLPSGGKKEVDAIERVQETAKSLNDGMEADSPIRFSTNGSGTGFTWSAIA